MASAEEAFIRSKWTKLPEWQPSFVDRHINNITRPSIICNKASNVYNLTNPDYVEGVIILSLQHFKWLLPALSILLLTHFSRYLRRPPGCLNKTLRSCICLCVTAILIVTAIEIFLYNLLARLPPFFTMHPKDNDEIINMMSNLESKIKQLKQEIHEPIYTPLNYENDEFNTTWTKVLETTVHLVYAGDNIYSMYRDPNYTTPIVSALTEKLLEYSWHHLVLFQGEWIVALISIFIITLLRSRLAGAFCAILWCGIGAMSVTWVAVQLADACMLPSRAIKSLPDDWTYKEMYSILKEYERVCEEFEAQFSPKVQFYRDRYDEVVGRLQKYLIYGGENRDYFVNMEKRFKKAFVTFMKIDLILKCKYNTTASLPKSLPPYDEVIRRVCDGSRKLQLLLLQAVILVLASIISILLLVWAIITMEKPTCPSGTCPNRQKLFGNGSCTSIRSCGPCSSRTSVVCSARKGKKRRVDPNACPASLPKKLYGCSKCVFKPRPTVCNAINLDLRYNSFDGTVENVPCNVHGPPKRCSSNPVTSAPRNKSFDVESDHSIGNITI